MLSPEENHIVVRRLLVTSQIKSIAEIFTKIVSHLDPILRLSCGDMGLKRSCNRTARGHRSWPADLVDVRFGGTEGLTRDHNSGARPQCAYAPVCAMERDSTVSFAF